METQDKSRHKNAPAARTTTHFLDRFDRPTPENAALFVLRAVLGVEASLLCATRSVGFAIVDTVIILDLCKILRYLEISICLT
jgi:hypothetical protein